MAPYSEDSLYIQILNLAHRQIALKLYNEYIEITNKKHILKDLCVLFVQLLILGLFLLVFFLT